MYIGSRRKRIQDSKFECSSRVNAVWVGLVEGVAGSCELVHDHVAEIAEVVEPFAEDVVDIDAICFLSQ